MTVVCASRTDLKARQGCRALQVCADAHGFKSASGMPCATSVRLAHDFESVGRGHVPAGAGTTGCIQTRSSVPSAASRSARPVVVLYDPSIAPSP